MASEPIRDPNKDHLLTPKNCTFLIIDYQPGACYRATRASRFSARHRLASARAALAGFTESV
jgi:hypothetical protein